LTPRFTSGSAPTGKPSRTSVRDIKPVPKIRGSVLEASAGAKRRDQCPGLDALLKDASRRKFDVVLAWAIDRLGRSPIDLFGTIDHLEAAGCCE